MLRPKKKKMIKKHNKKKKDDLRYSNLITNVIYKVERLLVNRLTDNIQVSHIQFLDKIGDLIILKWYPKQLNCRRPVDSDGSSIPQSYIRVVHSDDVVIKPSEILMANAAYHSDQTTEKP